MVANYREVTRARNSPLEKGYDWHTRLMTRSISPAVLSLSIHSLFRMSWRAPASAGASESRSSMLFEATSSRAMSHPGELTTRGMGSCETKEWNWVGNKWIKKSIELWKWVEGNPAHSYRKLWPYQLKYDVRKTVMKIFLLRTLKRRICLWHRQQGCG